MHRMREVVRRISICRRGSCRMIIWVIMAAVANTLSALRCKNREAGASLGGLPALLLRNHVKRNEFDTFVCLEDIAVVFVFMDRER